MYYAHDNRSTSSFVIASVAERSFFDALHTNIVAKSTIVGQNKCACRVEKNLLSCCVALYIYMYVIMIVLLQMLCPAPCIPHSG